MPVPLSIIGVVEDSAWRPVSGATVVLSADTDAEASATTDRDGGFTLSVSRPAAGIFALRASKEGFSPASQSWNVSYHSQPQSQPLQVVFRLTEVAPLLDLAGDHTLTLSADTTCEGFPPPARTRTYQASIEATAGHPSHFSIRLSGNSFLPGHDSLGAIVATDFVRFFVFPGRLDNDEAVPVVEELSRGTFLALVGTAKADVNPRDRTIAGRFDGWIEYCPATPSTPYFQCPVKSVGCRSSSHQLILTRK
jgi:hypothetical protein